MLIFMGGVRPGFPGLSTGCFAKSPGSQMPLQKKSELAHFLLKIAYFPFILMKLL